MPNTNTLFYGDNLQVLRCQVRTTVPMAWVAIP